MITIIFAPPRYGKTAYMTFRLNEYAFDRKRYLSMKREIENKNNNGFNLTLPKTLVSANYPITFKKFGYSPRRNRLINPYRLGFSNGKVKTHFNAPYEVIGITEAQKYLNSRKSASFPSWQSRWYEQHGHNNLEIFLDVQRPKLIDANIRELACFVEILNLDFTYNKFGKIKKMTWLIREIENSYLFDRYIASGKLDKKCYVEKEVSCNYNVFDLYDSQCCKPLFYAGHFDEDFDLEYSSSFFEDKDSYLDYVKSLDIELPKDFYKG